MLWLWILLGVYFFIGFVITFRLLQIAKQKGYLSGRDIHPPQMTEEEERWTLEQINETILEVAHRPSVPTIVYYGCVSGITWIYQVTRYGGEDLWDEIFPEGILIPVVRYFHILVLKIKYIVQMVPWKEDNE